MRIVVVEDEIKMAALLKRGLEHEGYAVDVCGDGLDAMIPGCDGFGVCRNLRREGRWAPVLMLTARDELEDRVAGLDSGADDYLTKPFAFAELFARLRAIMRLAARSEPAYRTALRRPRTKPLGVKARFGRVEARRVGGRSFVGWVREVTSPKSRCSGCEPATQASSRPWVSSRARRSVISRRR